MKTICAGCGKEIPPSHPRLGVGDAAICMGCEGATITVWKVTCGGSSYIDRDSSGVELLLKTMEDDDVYTISRVEMPLGEYLSLPEFDGF